MKPQDVGDNGMQRLKSWEDSETSLDRAGYRKKKKKWGLLSEDWEERQNSTNMTVGV